MRYSCFAYKIFFHLAAVSSTKERVTQMGMVIETDSIYCPTFKLDTLEQFLATTQPGWHIWTMDLREAYFHVNYWFMTLVFYCLTVGQIRWDIAAKHCVVPLLTQRTTWVILHSSAVQKVPLFSMANQDLPIHSSSIRTTLRSIHKASETCDDDLHARHHSTRHYKSK